MKKWIAALLAVAMLCALLPQVVLFAGAEGETSGTCGESLAWTYDGTTGCLSISGSGKMVSWTDLYSVPWYQYHSDIVKVVLPEGLTSIEQYAFAYTSLEQVYIPATVTEIDRYAFFRCEKLAEINVSEDNAVYSSEQGVLFDKEKKTLIRCPVCFAGEYSVPDGVETIALDAFEECHKLTALSMTDSVLTIDGGAFEKSGIQSIRLSDMLKTVGHGVFMGSKIVSVEFPDTVTSLGTNTFSDCRNLESVKLPSNLQSIPYLTFENCEKLTNIEIPPAVQTVEYYSFWDCKSLQKIILPASVTRVDEDAFLGCSSLRSIEVDNANCSFYASKNTLGTPGTTVIRGHDASTAETYAAKYGYTFASLECEHSWDAGIVLKTATCEEKGQTLYTCEICGYEKTVTEDALGHTFAYHVCTRCGEIESFRIKDVSLSWGGHSAAVTEEGYLYVWGNNSNGQIGDGSTEDALQPVYIMDGVAEIELGKHFSAALKENGDLYTWGKNSCGQIGNGTTEDMPVPYKVLSNVVSFDTGDEYIAAVTEDGSFYLWGSNGDHQINTSESSRYLTPANFKAAPKDYILDNVRRAEILESGVAALYGKNVSGEIGAPYGRYSGTVNLSGEIEQIAFSDGITGRGARAAALTEDGVLYHWGDRTVLDYAIGSVPAWVDGCSPIELLTGIKQMSLGDLHGGAVTYWGELYTWGEPSAALGWTDYSDCDSRTAKVIMDRISSCKMEYEYSTAIDYDGTLYCWGVNTDGQIGCGPNAVHVNTPTAVLDNVASVETSYTTMAAIDKDGQLFLWGDNFCGQIGNGDLSDQYTPYRVKFPMKIVPQDECEHSWGSSVITKDPTCTEYGEETLTCEICGFSETRELLPLGHHYVSYVCTNCGKNVLNTVSVSYDATDGGDVGATLDFSYSDLYFEQSAYEYNHDIAKLALGMTMATSCKDNTYVVDLLQDVGCMANSIQTGKFGITDDASDTCAYAFGTRYLEESDSFLIQVIVRSSNYGGEWASNVHVSEGHVSERSFGFNAAADDLYRDLTVYIESLKSFCAAQGFDGTRVKYLVCGFSRGGAIANLLGARLTSESNGGGSDIYTYTFATPETVKTTSAVAYPNIHNIVSEIDIVPRVPLESWGYTRYGITHYLPCQASSGTKYAGLLKNMQTQFDKLMKNAGKTDRNIPQYGQECAIDLLLEYLTEIADSTDEYEDCGLQSLLMDFLEQKNKNKLTAEDVFKDLEKIVSASDECEDCTVRSLLKDYLEQNGQNELPIDTVFEDLEKIVSTTEEYENCAARSLLIDFIKQKKSENGMTVEDVVEMLFDGHKEEADVFIKLMNNIENAPSDEKKAYYAAEAFEIVHALTTGEDPRIESALKGKLLRVVSEILCRFGYNCIKEGLHIKSNSLAYIEAVAMVSDMVTNGFASALLMQHWPESYLAWMNSGTPDQIFRSNAYKRVSVKCPVDITVVNSKNVVVARVIDDQVDTTVENSLLVMLDACGEKDIYLPDDDAYTIVVNPRESGGTIDIVECEYSENHRLVSSAGFMGLAMEWEREYYVSVPEGQDEHTEVLLRNFLDMPISATYTEDAGQTEYEISVNSECPELVFGAGTYAIGDTVSLCAASSDEYGFDGWYDGNVCVCDDNLYQFSAVEDKTLTAVYHRHELTAHSDTATCTEGGEAEYICTVCQYTFTGASESLGHDFVDGVCSRCGETEPTDPTEPTEPESSEPIETESSEPIETESSEPIETESSEPIETESSEPIVTETEPIETEPIVTEPIETEPIETECSHANTEVRDALEPTCVAPGYTGDTYCLDCGEKTAEGTEIEALGHDWDDGVIAPTGAVDICDYDKDILIFYTCLRCGETREETEPAEGCPSKDFTDVGDATVWYHNAADFAIRTGIMGSTTPDALTFSPMAPTTRATIIQILYAQEGKPEVSGTLPFSDVVDDAWYYNASLWALQNGIISGYGNGKFGPNDQVTREQLAVILKAYAYFKGCATEETADISAFPDANKATWSAPYMKWAVAIGILSGKGQADGSVRLDPQGKASRAEAATVLYKYIPMLDTMQKLADPMNCNHSYELLTSAEASCTLAGYYVYACYKCGAARYYEETPAYGHDWSRAHDEPTCTEDGHDVLVCDRCREVIVQTTYPAYGHNFNSDGYCSRCYQLDPTYGHMKKIVGTWYANALVYVDGSGGYYERGEVKLVIRSDRTATVTIKSSGQTIHYQNIREDDYDDGIYYFIADCEGYNVWFGFTYDQDIVELGALMLFESPDYVIYFKK